MAVDVLIGAGRSKDTARGFVLALAREDDGTVSLIVKPVGEESETRVNMPLSDLAKTSRVVDAWIKGDL